MCVCVCVWATEAAIKISTFILCKVYYCHCHCITLQFENAHHHLFCCLGVTAGVFVWYYLMCAAAVATAVVDVFNETHEIYIKDQTMFDNGSVYAPVCCVK